MSIKSIFAMLRRDAEKVWNAEYERQIDKKAGQMEARDKAWIKVDEWAMKALEALEFRNHPEVTVCLK